MNDGAGGTDEFAPDPRNVRLLKWAIYIMSALLVIGTIVVVVTIAKRASRLADKPQGGFGDVELKLPGAAQVTDMEMDGDRMAVHTSGPGGRQIIILNVRRGTVEGRFSITHDE